MEARLQHRQWCSKKFISKHLSARSQSKDEGEGRQSIENKVSLGTRWPRVFSLYFLPYIIHMDYSVFLKYALTIFCASIYNFHSSWSILYLTSFLYLPQSFLLFIFVKILTRHSQLKNTIFPKYTHVFSILKNLFNQVCLYYYKFID